MSEINNWPQCVFLSVMVICIVAMVIFYIWIESK